MTTAGSDESKPDLNEPPHKRPRIEGDAAAEVMGVEGSSVSAGGEDGTGGRGGQGERSEKKAACLKAREKILAVERDYTRFYMRNVCGEEGADQFVYLHFNSLYVIGIAPSHAAISNGRQVEKVDFDVGRSGDKLANKPTGKKKAGAM